MSESSVELQEVGRVSDLSALSPRERRECWPVAAIARREEWPTSQLTQRICLQQQGMSQQMVEVGLAAVGEDLQAVAEALHTCQAAHAQVDITMMAGKRGKNMKQQKKKSRPCHPAKVADQRSCIRHGKKNCERNRNTTFFSGMKPEQKTFCSGTLAPHAFLFTHAVKNC
ncbi:uncharacterized protein [Dermacentor andersoni]|uniref:uncharacterized protein isoform X5 n=1 Tax=Dermacentor andersoni TaxID=34620 RepID=UPI003B3A9104